MVDEKPVRKMVVLVGFSHWKWCFQWKIGDFMVVWWDFNGIFHGISPRKMVIYWDFSWDWMGSLPLWLCQNSYWKWWFSSWIFPLKMGGSFQSYVKLPEGNIRNGDFPWGFLTIRNFWMMDMLQQNGHWMVFTGYNSGYTILDSVYYWMGFIQYWI